MTPLFGWSHRHYGGRPSGPDGGTRVRPERGRPGGGRRGGRPGTGRRKDVRVDMWDRVQEGQGSFGTGTGPKTLRTETPVGDGPGTTGDIGRYRFTTTSFVLPRTPDRGGSDPGGGPAQTNPLRETRCTTGSSPRRRPGSPTDVSPTDGTGPR